MIGVVSFVSVFRTALYHRFCLFPKEMQVWEDIRAKRVPVTLESGWKEFRGVMHAHSELSFDSVMSFPDIAAALHKAEVDFVFMAEHPSSGKAGYAKGWKGLHEGILFVRGYEMQEGFMPWGLPDGTVLDTSENPALLAKKIKDLGGVLFFAHCEEERLWEIPDVTGMEIDNLDTDLMDGDTKESITDILLNLRSYPDLTLRLMFSRPLKNLARWDELNRTRHITGIAGSDAHQNVGARGVYTADGTLRILDTGHLNQVLTEIKLNGLTRLLLRLLCGPLVPDRQVFRIDLDPYEQSVRFVNTHLLASECTEPALLDALRQGRAFVAFDMIADARGFVSCAEGSGKKAVMGESIPFAPGLRLRMASPHACRFTILRYEAQVAQGTGNTFDWTVPGSGKYRVEAELDLLGKWTPWIYTNAIAVTAP